MTDFRQAFKMGLDAHDRATHARNEIFQVFDDFASQVKDASGGIIEIQWGVAGRQEIKILAEAMSSLGSPPYDHPTSGVLRGHSRRNEGSIEELCEYSLGDEGYPVALRYSREHVRCHDREDLERALEELLKNPSTGSRLLRLMQVPSSQEQTSPPE